MAVAVRGPVRRIPVRRAVRKGKYYLENKGY
jgi:hypothetical protein